MAEVNDLLLRRAWPVLLVFYSQFYRTRTAEQPLEIGECLRRNLNHPGIGLLLNADIYLDEELEHLAASFDSPETFLALIRCNPGYADLQLNNYSYWIQDVCGVRDDAELRESLLYASSSWLRFAGCDNHIAYLMWSHSFRVRNPCHHTRSVHLQASTACAYDQTGDRLYDCVSYLHPSLGPDEDAELEFTLWNRSKQRPAGMLINQQVLDQHVHQPYCSDADFAQRFLDLQHFIWLSWVYKSVGSAHLQGKLHSFTSKDPVFLPLLKLMEKGVELQRPTRLYAYPPWLPCTSPPPQVCREEEIPEYPQLCLSRL